MKAEKTRKHIMTTDNWLGYITADPIWDEIAEIERLSEIGRATEKAFYSPDTYLHIKEIAVLRSVEELLKWATHEAKGDKQDER